MLLIIDNYDSFTYNLVQYLGELGAEMHVVRNDEVSCEEIRTGLKPNKILISPGPGTPDDSGVSLEVVSEFSGEFPVLGVCLGHQAIGQAFGAKVIRAPVPVHGKPASINHNGEGLFESIANPFEAARYHSLVISRDQFPDALEITAETSDGIIMGIRHKEFETYGVQFHPESILTAEGKNLLQNFLRI